ncbi:hypothetical protein [Gottfriedia solisilvae]|uniref:Uncharacterized protein n=1 Tax=Gottfriedia solisilvae TaxID=1516104 RepID=A0A8J3ANU4_9BACI|nr:hypothetical protein [Gottfriedia solisilvae]GGI17953.1 hypothetical protein GCM10007380_40510 [Gottfriedia solisilvae]
MPGFTTIQKNNTVTVSAKIDGIEVRNVKIEIGNEYICLPFNKNKKLHRERRFIVNGFDNSNHELRAKVKFSDTKGHGFVDVTDIEYIIED